MEMKTNRVLKICPTEFLHESRDERELRVYKDMGADVCVMAKETSEIVNDVFKIDRLTTRPLGNRLPNSINRICSFFLWVKKAREYKADIISGHDIICTYMALLSNIGRKGSKRAKIVYDSHEFEIGRTAKRRNVTKKVISLAERFAIKRVDETIVVSNSIAQEIKKVYRLDKAPSVVRNIPEKWDVDKKQTKDNADDLKTNMKDVKYIISYHGIIAPSRGIETAIDMIEKTADLGLIIIGYALMEDYLDTLKKSVAEKGLEDRVLFLGAVNNRDLWRYIGAADLSFLMLPPASASYYYSLPNKLFEAIQSETPLIASDFPEIRSIVDKYKVGVIAKWDDIDDIVSKAEGLLSDKGLYSETKSNVAAAKEELCWENEKKILQDIYLRLTADK